MSTLLGPGARTAASLGFGQVLGRLLLAGLLGSLLAGAWLLLVTEPMIRAALVVEQARRTESAPELVSRTTQVLGGVLGTVITGVVLAFVFATVYAQLRHRLPGRTDLARATLLAAIAFGIFGLLPAVLLPANPPGVGEQATVGTRTAIYGAVLLCGVVVAMATCAVVTVLRDRGVEAVPTAVAVTVLVVVLVAVVALLLPGSPDSVPDDVPASMVWQFRLASLGQQLVLWGCLGLAGGWLLDRAGHREP